ncbi:hypothetical protein TNCV_2054351 [Trichonephila clavipes]|nr:hypothetical protein TNCV_2054351 [Trichonephila clavipes]
MSSAGRQNPVLRQGMSNGQAAAPRPASGVCPVDGRQILVLRQGYVQCPVAGRQNPVLLRGYVQWLGTEEPRPASGGMSSGRAAEPRPELGVCPVARRRNPILRQRYIQCTGGRTQSCARGMSSSRLAEPFPASGVCPLVGQRNLVLLRGYIQ